MRMIEQFIHYIKYEKRYSDHTMAAYRTDLVQFYNFYTTQYDLDAWKEIESFHLRSWIFELVDQGLSKRTINRKLSSVRSFFDFLTREYRVGMNPAADIQSIKTGRTLPEVIPMETMQQFFMNPPENGDWIEWRDFILIGMLYETGMRRGELAELRWADIDMVESWVTVTGKGNKQRKIPLRPSFTEKIQRYQEILAEVVTDGSQNLFLTDRGSSVYPKWIYNRVRYLLRPYSNSEKLSPHTLRHSIATHLLMNGADIQIIREFLGHSSLAATEIYTHNSIEKLKKTYRKALPDLDHIH